MSHIPHSALPAPLGILSTVSPWWASLLPLCWPLLTTWAPARHTHLPNWYFQLDALQTHPIPRGQMELITFPLKLLLRPDFLLCSVVSPFYPVSSVRNPMGSFTFTHNTWKNKWLQERSWEVLRALKQNFGIMYGNKGLSEWDAEKTSYCLIVELPTEKAVVTEIHWTSL